ncbi:MAG: phosphatase PAP2 family protein [Aeromicrobium sp.]
MQTQVIRSVDSWLLEVANWHRHEALTWFARLVMTAGHTVRGVAVLGTIALLIVIALRLWRPSIAAVMASFAAGQTADILKDVIGRPRPPASLAIVPAYGFSMPSSVAATTSAAAVAFILAIRWKSGRLQMLCSTVAAIAVVGVGVCMVYLGAHWASDVFAGWVLGSAFGVVAGLVFRERKKDSAPDKPSERVPSA